MDKSEPVENHQKSMLDEPASSEPKLEDIFHLPNSPVPPMVAFVANAFKTLNSMDTSSGSVSNS